LTATVSPSNATNSNVTWSSSNRSVATVSGAGSRATVAALANGEATITVRTEDGGKTATCAVTVVIPATSVTLDKESFLRLPIGGSSTLTATILPDSASSYGVIWTSDAPNIASVSGNGLNATVTALADGWATITATTAYGEKTATCKVIVSDDPYNVKFALKNAIEAFLPKVMKKDFSEQENKKYSEELKQIYVEAFAKDTYSANFPFSSKQLKAAMTPLVYHFSNSVGASAAINVAYIGTGSANTVYSITETIVHETGHIWGLDESLTCLQCNKYLGNGIGVNDRAAILDNLYYSPFYDNLLLERVEDKKFWGTIYEGVVYQADARYGKMWDENMTITVNNQKEQLVLFNDMQAARALSYYVNNRNADTKYNEIASGFERFAGITDVKDEFKKLGPVFEKAFKNNDPKSIEAVQKFFGTIKEYNEIYRTLKASPIITPYLANFMDNMNKYKSQTLGANQGMINVNLGQEVGCCR